MNVFLWIVTGLFLLPEEKPLEVAIIGLSHTHVHWIFNSEKRGDIKIVGIVEENTNLARRYCDQYNYPLDKVYKSEDQMLQEVSPEAVTAFGPIYDHLRVVEVFAPLGIHIMVEKPLAVNLEHAYKMQELAEKYQVHLLTNYETTWYPTNHLAYEKIHNDSILGDVRKIIVRDGHRGPKKIGVDDEFLVWLTDPVKNGGGAITDFGCYGANLITWLMKGEKPISVTAITQQLQPENNPQVDDEAIILLKYPQATGVIQASWNWTIGRKDMEIYGLKGVFYADNRNKARIRIAEGYDGYEEEHFDLPERERPLDDPFSLLKAVIRGDIKLEKFDLNSLANNMIVMEILEAAISSAKEGKTIFLKD